MNMSVDEAVIDDDKVSSNTKTSSSGNPGIQSILDALGNGGAQMIMDALGSGASGATVINSFLAQANIPDEQQSLVNLLLSMGDNNSTRGQVFDAESDIEEGIYDESDYDDEGHSRSNVSDIRQFREELNDLRDVNDTVAAALGACPVCWGGDTGCVECQGAGYSGSMMPDAKLFKELVLPAIRRMRAVSRPKKAGLARKRVERNF